MEQTNEWLRTPEAAEYLKISVSTLRKKVMNRSVPHHKWGGTIYFRADELDKMINSHRVETKPIGGRVVIEG